jgi:hypothetical protein
MFRRLSVLNVFSTYTFILYLGLSGCNKSDSGKFVYKQKESLLKTTDWTSLPLLLLQLYLYPE